MQGVHLTTMVGEPTKFLRFDVHGLWTITGLFTIGVGLYLTSLYSYLLFHTVVEVFVIAVALCIFFITWNSQKFIRNGYLLFIGIAYLFVGAFDLLHTIAYKGIGIFSGYDTDLPTQLWISARYIESVSLLVATLFFTRRPNLNLEILIYSFVSVALLISIFYLRIFPQCYVENQGLTQFKIASEYIICLLVFASLILLIRSRKRFEPQVFRLMVAALLTTIATELTFTLYISVYGWYNLVGHYLKLLSFYLIYKALIETGFRQPYDLLFRELDQERLRLNQEIDRREHLERELRSSEERYRIVADFAYDWEFWVDPEGWFVYVSPSCERITGHSATEFLTDPKLFLKIVFDEDRPLVEEHFKTTLAVAESKSATFDFRIKHKNGAIRWVNHSCQAVTGSDGVYRGRRASNRDVTEARKAMELIRQSDRHRAVADLSGGIAHNFNNLLQIVISGIENAISDIREGDLKKAENSLNLILDSCDRGADTVRKLLHFASTRSENQNSSFRVIDLTDLVKEAVEVTRPFWEDEAVREGIQIEMKVTGQTDIYVEGRFSQLVDVVITLIRNAVEAIRDKGVIEINLDIAKDQGIIAVKDTGIGMSQSDLNRIFTPFFTTKVTAGSGLALATALKIVDNHGGQIVVESVPGQGTTFRIILPLSAERPKRESSQDGYGPTKGTKILVVDDAKAVTDMLGAVLSKEGYVVSTATSGDQAIKMFRQESIDAIVCDLGMPDINGLELCRRIKAISEYRGERKPPCIIITGWEQKLTAEFLKAGVDDILRKPVKVGMLLASLEKSFRDIEFNTQN